MADDIDGIINEMMSMLDQLDDVSMQLRDMRNRADDKRELRKACNRLDEAHRSMNEAFGILARYARNM